MKVCFLIPTTSNNREWSSILESYLYTLTIDKIKDYNNYEIHLYISYDTNDPIFDSEEEQLKINFKNIKWFRNTFEKGAVTHHWNSLYQEALLYNKNNKINNFDYYWLVGDDILYPDTDSWLKDLIDNLKKTNDIGISGCYNGNPNLPMTQFLVSKKHFDIFNNAFNPKILNHYCDNWLLEVYHKKYVHYDGNHSLINSGGNPRYEIVDASRLYKILVKRDKKKLMIYLNNSICN
jgi:hypothetical protein